jgi:PKHD-type hydroxylase
MTELVESDEIIEYDINSKINRKAENVEENMDLFKTVQSNLLKNYSKDVYTMFFYYSQKPLFLKEECKKIVEMGNSSKFDYQKFGTGQLDFTIFNAKRSYLFPNDDTNDIYQKIGNTIVEQNQKIWNFNLFDFGEPIKFMEYNEYMTGHAAMHTDLAHHGVTRFRKLTIIIQLTDKSEYEGGELILQHYEKPYIMPKTQGTIIIFPSFLLHEVKPVTKGVRNSLVAFAYGPPFC